MNEQYSWCSGEGGLGNSSRSRNPDSAGMGWAGAELSSQAWKNTGSQERFWGDLSVYQSAVPNTRVLLLPWSIGKNKLVNGFQSQRIRKSNILIKSRRHILMVKSKILLM